MRLFKINNLIWILYIFYIFSIVAFGDRSEYYLISNVTFLILIALMIIYVWPSILHIRKKQLMFLPFAIFCFASCIWSYSVDSTFIRTITVFELVILFIVLCQYLQKTRETKRYYMGFAIAGVVVSVYTIVFYGGISGLREILDEQTRLGEEIVNSNTLAMFLAISSCVFLFLFLEQKKWLYLLLVLLIVAIIALTGSKKGIIDIGLGFLFTILLGQSKSKTPKFITWVIRLVIFGMVVSFCWQLPIFNTIRLRLEMMFATIFESNVSSTTDYSTLQRQALIRIGIEQFFETPLLGVGIDASGFLGKLAINSTTYLHNNYIELLATGGIVGILMYYFPFVKFLISNWKTRNYSVCSRISVVVLLLQFINDSAAVQYASKLTYVVAALALSSYYECYNTQKDKSRS